MAATENTKEYSILMQNIIAWIKLLTTKFAMRLVQKN